MAEDWTAEMFTPGTILRVRGFCRGRHLPPRRAVVIGTIQGRPAVWFYTQGAPEPGATVQPLYTDSDLTATGLTIQDLSDRMLRSWERQLSPCSGELHRFGWRVHEVAAARRRRAHAD